MNVGRETIPDTVTRRSSSVLGGAIGTESQVGRRSRFEIRFPLRPCGVRLPEGSPIEKLSA
jgi:hypothetical protein